MSTAGPFNKGSILPQVLELEADLALKEDVARAQAAEIVAAARRDADRLIAETERAIPGLMAMERNRYYVEVSERTEALEREQDLMIGVLETCIRANRENAAALVLKRVLPEAEERRGRAAT